MQSKKKPKLFNTTIFTFVIIVLLPTFIIISYLFMNIRNEMITQKTQVETIAISQMAYNMESEIKKNMYIASAIVHDTDIMNNSLALKESKSSSDIYKNSKLLEASLKSYFVSNNFVGEIYLVFDDVKEINGSRNVAFIDADYELLNGLSKNTSPEIPNSQLVNNIYLSNGATYPSLLAIVTYPPVIWDYETSYTKEVLVTSLSSVKQFYDKENIESDSTLLLVNSDNKIMASNNVGLINTEYNQEEIERTDKIIIAKDLDDTSWKLIKILNPKTITANIDKIFFRVAILLFILILFYLAYNFIVLILILRPLDQMIANMSEVGKGIYKKDTYVTKFAELEELSDSFNSMVQELDELNVQIQKAHQETMMREIETLRFQLNPHFMCNSLSSIRMMAMITKNDAIKRMSTALMTIMEDNLNGTGSFTSVSHELKNIDSYVYIMQVRYGNSFSYEKYVDKECLNAEIPSMLLQPLIENSILHGFRNLDREGFITLRIEKNEEFIKITIRDNGKGISPDKIDNLFVALSSHDKGLNHIGLSNVKRRLEILYPKVGDITISGDDGDDSSYFMQVITIPFKQLSDEDLEIINRKRR